MLKGSRWDSLSGEERIAEFNVLGYANFITKHTFVSRALICNGEYSTRAFLMYLIQMKKVGYSSQEQYAERQADYMKWMWQSYNPMRSDSDAQDVWQRTRDSVIDELNSFKRDYQAAKEEVDQHRATITNSLKADLLKMLSQGGDARSRIARLYAMAKHGEYKNPNTI